MHKEDVTMRKESYERAELDVIRFTSADVITTSLQDPGVSDPEQFPMA